MGKNKKILENLNNPEYTDKIKEIQPEILEVSFVRKGKPENYVRERFTSRGKRFYNQKAGIMNDFNRFFKQEIDKDIHKRVLELGKDDEYYVEMECRFYMPIQKAESIIGSVKKEMGILKPAIRPDIDNYIKLLLDTLHNVVYDDDARVTKISGEKLYSLEPRTEIDIRIIIVNK